MSSEKRKHTPIEPPSPPQDNRQVDIVPLRTRRPAPVLTQRKRLSTHAVPQDNISPIRPQKTVFGRLGHRDQSMPQAVVKPQQPAAVAAAAAAVCRNFQRRGHCKYGDKCIYLHQLSTGDSVDQQEEQKIDLRITRTTGSSSGKRTEKTDSLQNPRKVVLEETAHSSTYSEGKEYDEALLLERRRQEIKLELQRLEAEPKQKDLIVSVEMTGKSSPSEGEASSSSGEDQESSGQQSSTEHEAAEEHTAQPRSAIIVPSASDRTSRSSNREERRPRSIVKPVVKSPRTVPAARTDSRTTADKERKRTSNDPRRDTARPARPPLNERTTTSGQVKRSHAHPQRETARQPSTRGPPLQSQEEQYRERRNEPLPIHHADPKRQDGRRLPQRHDSSTHAATSSSTQPTSSRSHQRNHPSSTHEERSQSDRSRSREHQKQSQHKHADSRTRESASTSGASNTPKESSRNLATGEDHPFASRRSDEVRRSQYLSETDDRVAADEYSRQHSNPRRPARPKPLAELSLPTDAVLSQRSLDLAPTTLEYSHKRAPLSRHVTSISGLSSSKSIELQRSDRMRAKEPSSKKRAHDQPTDEDVAWPSKTHLEPPQKQSRKDGSRARETKVNEEAYEGAKSQATVLINDTEFAVDAISDDEEDGGVDQTVEQVTDDASDEKDHVSGAETPPSHTPTRADPVPAEVEDEHKGTKTRKKFLSYGESTGSIDERALPEAEELEDISDDELGDASSISSTAHGGHHKLSAADWASLIEPKQVMIEKAPSSARQRFTPQNFLRTCAISSKHIPSTLATQIEQMCNLKAEEEDAHVDAPKTPFRFLAGSGAEHMVRMREADELASPFLLVGAHRRALCARDDLRFRRRLCGYGPELADPSTTNEHGMPFLPSLFEKSKQLFVDQQKIVASQ